MRHRRVWTLVGAGALAAVTLSVAVLAVMTRTQPGREYVLGQTLTALGGRLNGELLISRLDGNLITGARLYEVVLKGEDGEVVLASDSAYINYELPTLVGGDVVLNSLVLYGAKVNLVRLPGDSLWNYQQILVDTTTTAREGPSRATLLQNARLVDAIVTVRMPWEPDPELPPGERQAEIEAAVSDTSRLVVEEVPGGYLRTIGVRVENLTISDLVIAGEERGGTYLVVESATAQVKLYAGDPLRLLDLGGTLSFDQDILRLSAPTIVLPGSRFAARGSVDLSGDDPALDLHLEAPRVSLTDLQPLYPPLPEDGQASFELWLETRPEGLYYAVNDLRLALPETRLVGQFGMLAGDELLFTDVDLTADPLSIPEIERVLPADLPVRGLTIGAAEITTSET